MNNFEFYSPTRFVFGREAEAKVGELVKANGGTKALLHFGGGSVKRNGVYDKVVAALTAAGVEYVPLGGVKPNPRSGLVREGIEICRREKIDFVLAVGGGSVIDSAKAIAFGTLLEGDFAEKYVGKDAKVQPRIEKALPIGTVLTIAAAGSEGSGNSIVTIEETGRKLGAKGEVLRPRFSIMNPELTMTLPPYQVACGAVDMFAHLVERYFTPTQGVRVSDEMCEGLMRAIVEASRKAIVEPSNYEARADLMWAGTLAHNDVCGVGRVQDWASHGIEHEISAMYDVAHGAGLAVVMPAWMEYVKGADIERFVRFATKVWGVSEEQVEGGRLEVEQRRLDSCCDFNAKDAMTALREDGDARPAFSWCRRHDIPEVKKNASFASARNHRGEIGAASHAGPRRMLSCVPSLTSLVEVGKRWVNILGCLSDETTSAAGNCKQESTAQSGVNGDVGKNVMWECGNMELRKWGSEKLRNCGSEEVGGEEVEGGRLEIAEEGIRRYREWIKSLGMPSRLGEIGVKEEDIPILAANLKLGENKLGSFMPLSENDVVEILKLAK